MKNSTNLVVALVLASLILALGIALPGYTPLAQAQPGESTPVPTRVLPSNQSERGLIFDGLEPALDGPCRGLARIGNTNFCTPGPDPAPLGTNIAESVPPVQQPGKTSIECIGDGSTGKRTQVIYARASDHADRYDDYVSSIQSWSAGVDSIYRDSAAETGGFRAVVFVHDASCNIIVANAVLSPSGDNTINNTMSELKSLGYNKTDRKYLIFMDANIYCGIATITLDDQPASTNLNNRGPSYARVDAGCWNSKAAAHEHMHNLGGVQHTAPHTSYSPSYPGSGGHCVDEWDIMCYSDAYDGVNPPMQYLCMDYSHDSRFDCNHDDYFNTNPPAGTYLTSRWNAANNQFLFSGTGTATPTRTPTPTPSRTPTPTDPSEPTSTPTATTTPDCSTKPAKPALASPKDGKTVKVIQVPLNWDDASCANSYRVLVREDSKTGKKADSKSGLHESHYTTDPLTAGKTYFWRVTACNANKECAKSGWWSFTIK